MKKIYLSLCFLTALIGFSNSSFAQIASFTTSDSTGCGSVVAHFTNTSSGFSSSHWDFGNSNTSDSTNASATYGTPGIYIVTLTVSNGVNSSSVTHTITVYSVPVASFIASPDTIICVGAPITFISTSTAGAGVTGGAVNQWHWVFGDGNTDNSNDTVVNTYTVQNTFTVSLAVTDIHGCVSIIQHNVTSVTGPVASFTATPSSSCDPAPVSVSFLNTTTGSATGFQWTFGDGSPTSNAISPTHPYNSNNSFVVTLTAFSPGCNSVAQTTLHLNHTTANFTMSDTAVCRGNSLTFTNTTNPGGGTYLWDFGDPSSGIFNDTSSLTNPSHTFFTVGIDSVRLISTVNGCTDTIKLAVHVRALPVPVITAIPSNACHVPDTVLFNVTNPNIVSWQWNFNDPASLGNNTSSIQGPTHIFNNFGTYHPTVTITDIYGCVGTNFDTIRIQPPNVDFTPKDSGCVPLTVNYTSISTSIDPIVSYIWNFGDGTPNDTTTTPTNPHTFNIIGIFDVSLTIITQSGCTATILKPGWARAGTPPHADFTWDHDTVCFGQSVNFTSITPQPVTGWVWTFGDGGGSQGSPFASHQYDIDTATNEPFTVTLIAYYNGCPDDTVKQHIITVLLPIPDFIPHYNCDTPYVVTFQDTSRGATSYLWDFGDPTSGLLNTSILQDPIHTFTGRGSFFVTLTDSNSTTHCTYFKTILVQITDPKAHFTASATTGCYPLSVFFDGAISQDEDLSLNPIPSPYLWNFGDPSSGPLNNGIHDTITHVFNAPGVYTVRLTIVDIHNCTNDSTITITVVGPTAGFTSTPASGCVPLNVVFTDTSHTAGSAITNWYWNFDPTNNVNTLPHTYSTRGNYNDTLIVTDANGCKDTAVIVIHANQPTPNAIATDTICPNVPITFNVTSGPFVATPVTYDIDFGDGFQATALDATSHQFIHTYTSNADNLVTIHVTDANGCDSIFTTHMVVLKPTANFNVTPIDTCIFSTQYNQYITGVFAIFTDNSSDTTATGNIWNWSPDIDGTGTGGVLSTLHDPSFQYTIYGQHSPTLVLINGAGCSDTLVYPNIHVGGPQGTYTFTPTIGCHPLPVNFLAATTGGGTSYTWDFGDGNVVDIPDTVTTHTYQQDGIYHPYFFINYTFASGGTCLSVGINPTPDTVVTVQTYIVLNIDSSSVTLHEGESTTVHASLVDTATGALPVVFTWTPAGEISGLDSNATLFANNITESTYYYCTVTDQLGCKATDSVLVIFIPCDAIDSIPNVFTPNGDALNDYYYIDNLCQGNNFKFTIYNRWGRIIYESTDRYFHWDGKTTGGTEASDGTYYYVLNTGKHDKHGYIQLIRNGK